MIRLADLLSDIATSMGYYYNSSTDTDIDSDTTNKPRQKQMKRLINDAYDSVMQLMPKDFLRKERVIKIPAVYDTGTVSISQGGIVATGSGTTFTRSMQMRQILVSGDYRPYFLRLWGSGTNFNLVIPYAHSTASEANYKIASWAIPLPNDYLAPFGKKAVFNVDRNNLIPLINKQEFRAAYPITYKMGIPYCCCLDGFTSFPRLTDTGDVTKDSATVTFDNYAPVFEDYGRILRIEGDSIEYRIIGKSGQNVTVEPVVQRATDTGIDLDIDPNPQPLLWFNSAPSSELRILLRYIAKPQYLWTDEQRAELSGGYDMAFRKMAAFKVISAYSRDRMQKTEALAELTMALDTLPKYIDTSPIRKEINEDVRGYSRITFPNVGIAT